MTEGNDRSGNVEPTKFRELNGNIGRAAGDQERITHLKLSSSDTFIQEWQRENVAWITIQKLQAPKASAP